MEILSKQLNTYTFEDVVNFIKEDYQEDVQLDYKETLPDKEKLAKLVAAFANTRGGVVIVGVKEDRKTGRPIEWLGIDDDHYDEFVASVIGNISPVPAYEYQKIDPKEGKVFLLIRIFEGVETPYYVHNDRNIWVRTGTIRQSVDIASPEHVELLFKKHERAELSRSRNIERANLNYKVFLKTAEKDRISKAAEEKDRFEKSNKALEIDSSSKDFKPSVVQQSLGSNTSMLTIVLQPFYPGKQLIRPLELEEIIRDSEEKNLHYLFPMQAVSWESIAEGMSFLTWREYDGQINSQQVFANGLVYSSDDVLNPDRAGGKHIYLSWIISQLYVTLKGAKNLYGKFNYQGGLTGQVTLKGAEGITVHPAAKGFFEVEKVVKYDNFLWPIELDTRVLNEENLLREFVVNFARDLHWSLGFKEEQSFITSEYLNKNRYFTD